METPPIDSILVVWEFLDLFHYDILDVPLGRDFDFAIDLDLGTKHISIPLIVYTTRAEGAKGSVAELLE